MDLADLLKAMAPLRQRVAELERERAEAVLEGSAAVDSDVTMLEDLVHAAMDEALRA